MVNTFPLQWRHQMPQLAFVSCGIFMPATNIYFVNRAHAVIASRQSSRPQFGRDFCCSVIALFCTRPEGVLAANFLHVARAQISLAITQKHL